MEKQTQMEKIIVVFNMASKLGFNLNSLTVSEGIQLKNEIIDAIEQAQINSDNK